MQINPVSFYNPNNIQRHKPVAFGFNYGEVLDNKGNLKYKVLSDYMRSDLEWDRIAEVFESKFPGDEKVNFFVIGCSSGEEVFSYIMKLKTALGDRFKKYMKIVGIDINENNILTAKHGIIPMSVHEKNKIENRTNGNINEFLEYEKVNSFLYLSRPKSILTENSCFYRGDIRDIIDNLPEDRVILSCRNMWQYIPRKDQETLLKKLAEKYDGKQFILQIGKTDISNHDGIELLLRRYGFCPNGTDYMYEKTERGTYKNNYHSVTETYAS